MDSCHSAVIASARRTGVPTLGLSLPLLVAALAYLANLNASLLSDADTYWHLGAANWMFEHLSIPSTDPFSHTMRGAPWVTHEWLSEVILGLCYRLAGWAGLVMLASAAAAGALAMLCRYLLRHLEPIYALGFTALAALLIQDHLLARPHALAFPLIAAWGIVLVRAREAQRVPAWPWALLMMVWANLHGSFTLGLGLAAFFAAEALWEAEPGARRQLAWAWGRFLLLSLGAALVTPNGMDGLGFTAHVNGMEFSMENIAEWRSPDFQQFQPLEVVLMVGALALFLRGLRLPFMRAALLLGLLHLALKHGRHSDVLGLLFALALAESVGRQWGQRPGIGAAAALDRWLSELSMPAKPLATGLVIALLLGASSLIVRGDALRPHASLAPEAALRAVQAAAPKGQVMNGYNFGGYLIFSGISPAIDGRADMYGDAFVADYIKALRLEAPDRFLDLIEKYDIGWTLLSPDVAAVALLDRMPEWRRIYTDKTAVVHVKSKPN